MARRDSPTIYKLPEPFRERHFHVLDGWNWPVNAEMRLSETISEVPELADVVLEYVRSHTRKGQAAVVRCRTPRMAMTVRVYSDGLAPAES